MRLAVARKVYARGVDGLLREKTRPGRLARLSDEVAANIVAATLKPPPSETTHWTAVAMAKVIGVSVSSVQRVWRQHGLQPHRMRQFKLSNDKQFAEKLRDVVGLYIDAVVLSFDEKSQIQALDRTQPGLPLNRIALEEGALRDDDPRLQTQRNYDLVCRAQRFGRFGHWAMYAKHRHQEFIRFLNRIEAKVPKGKDIHVVLDNYAAHKHPKVLAWLGRHPRFTFHFTPTSASWLNAVQGFFGILTKRRLKRGVFKAWSICRSLFIGIWTNTISTLNPSPGPKIQKKSSPPSNAGTNC